MPLKSLDEIRERLIGPVCALPTVFQRDGRIDRDGIRAVIDHALEGGCDVVMLRFDTSLLSLLTDDEVYQLNRMVIEHIGPRAVSIATGRMWGLGKALEFAAFVEQLGFDLCMVRPANWAPATAESLAEYFRAVASCMRVMLVADVPIATCELIENEPNIAGYVEMGDLNFALELQMRWGDRWPLICGGGFKRHHLLWPHGHCAAWVDDFIASFPRPSQEYWAAIQDDDGVEAWNIAMRYESSWRAFADTFRCGDSGLRHAMLEIAGVAPRWRRLAAPDPTDDEMHQIRELLCQLGLLNAPRCHEES